MVIWNDELQHIMNEITSGDYYDRVYIGQDYFDASINRIACWVIAMRNTRKAILNANLMPMDEIKKAEEEKNFTKRLAMLEECKSLPFSAVWDYYCMANEKTGRCFMAF